MNNYNKYEAGKRFKEFLSIIEKSHGDFADELGVAHQYISKYIKGKLNIQNITEILFNYGCNLNWLFLGEGSMFADNEAGNKLRQKHKKEIEEADKEVERIKEEEEGGMIKIYHVTQEELDLIIENTIRQVVKAGNIDYYIRKDKDSDK